MKKIFIVGTLAAVVILALGVAGFAYAQSQTPPTPTNPDGTYGPGMMGGRGARGGMFGGGMQNSTGEYGPLHDYMFNAIAEAFGLTTDELQANHDAGKTMWDLAEELGISTEQFSAIMTEARTNAFEQAVADSVISQEQADWMLSRMGGQGGGFGSCMDGTGNFQGRGRGGRWNMQPSQPAQPGL